MPGPIHHAVRGPLESTAAAVAHPARGRGETPRYACRAVFDTLSDRLQAPSATSAAAAVSTRRPSRGPCARSVSRCSRPTSTSRSSSDFTAAVKERALGQDVAEEPHAGPAGRQDRPRGADRPSWARATRRLAFGRPPTVILLAGLQGSGKTTAAAKLAPDPPQATGSARRSSPATSSVRPPSTSSSSSAQPAPGVRVYRTETTDAGRRRARGVDAAAADGSTS